MDQLVIGRVGILDYRMPLKRPYGTARGVTRGSKNFIVEIHGTARDEHFSGVGECQPRHRLTGDIDIDTAWEFLSTAVATLPGQTLDVSDAEAAVDSVRQLMADLAELAREHSTSRNAAKPFRGTLLGLEVALLDLAARALGLPLAEVLGAERDEVAITVSTLSTQNSQAEFQRKVERQARYPMVRVKGTGDLTGDSDLLRLVHEANKAAGRAKPIWIDLNEGFDTEGAREFIARLAELIASGELPEVITLEQPIHGKYGEELAGLQRAADAATAEHGAGEIRIMPDESLWDVSDLEVIHSGSGARAMNIKTAKAGGLLASLDVARRAVEIKPDTHICIGGMVGTSDITTWALLQLARALPRVDYITAVPPGNVKKRISDPLTRFESRESNVHVMGDEPGIGAVLDRVAIAPFVLRERSFPEDAEPVFNFTESADESSTLPVLDDSSRGSGFSVLFLGDFHYGESYGTGGGAILPERGYEAGTSQVAPFVRAADYTVVNLETPVVDPDAVTSPLAGRKRFLHWADPAKTPSALRTLGVDAVSLANNHTLDYGREGLRQSIEALQQADITVFGVGHDIETAEAPLEIPLPAEHGGGVLSVHGMLQVPQRPSTVLDPFASAEESGNAPLSKEELARKRLRSRAGGPRFEIAFPHWGPNYKWRTPRQQSLGKSLLDAGADVVLGHGAHCMQEIEIRDDKWIVYGMGNGHFQAKGRFEKFIEDNAILPYSFWTLLTVDTQTHSGRRVRVRLYPVYSDNRTTDFVPAPVDAPDFQRVVDELVSRSGAENLIASGRAATGHDDLGRFVQLDVGIWQDAVDDETAAAEEHEPQPDQPAADSGAGASQMVVGAASRVARGVLRRAVRGLRRVRQGIESSRTDSGPTASKSVFSVIDEQSPRLYDDPYSQRLLGLVSQGRTLATQLIADVAVRDGATAKWFGGATCMVAWGEQRILLQGNRSVESSVAGGIIRDKYLTKTFLERGGSRSPKGLVAETAQEAVSFQQELGAPVVVKPRAGDRGRAVTVGLTDPAEIESAFDRASAEAFHGVLVEEYIRGEEFRCLATADECLSVVRRVQAKVTGDGTSTIAELIDARNEFRRQNPYLYTRLIKVDVVTRRHLKAQGLGLETVVKEGRSIEVRPLGNFSVGADPHECSDLVSDDLRQTAMAAVRSVPGLRWAGVDIVVSAESGLGYVLEINSNSGIGSHHFPLYGEPKPIAERIWADRRDRAASRATAVKPDESLPARVESAISIDGSLASLLRRSLRDDLQVEIQQHPMGVMSVQKSDGDFEWMRGTATTEDLSAVLSVLGRHGSVRRLLSSDGVPLVEGKRVRDERMLRDQMATYDGQAAVIGYLKPWRGEQRHRVSSADQAASALGTGRPVVQRRPVGDRYTVVATPTHTLLVVGAPQNSSVHEDVASSPLEKLSALAVSAVRAIPELRWAAVDIVVEDPLSTARFAVEGMSTSPDFLRGSQVLAGSVAELARWATGTAS